MGRKYRRSRERKLERREPKRLPYPRMLIVCEGKKTEPLYFGAIRQELRLPNAHIVIVHPAVTEPRQIVDAALDMFRQTREFEMVFVVFDRDEHRTYADALQRAKALHTAEANDAGEPVPFHAIPSVPCFELWVLLHYLDIQGPLHRHDALKQVKTRLPKYDKGWDGTYASTKSDLATAAERARKLRQRFRPESGDDPYTAVDVVVDALMSCRY